MTKPVLLNLTVNGEAVSSAVEPRLSLADFLREEVGLKGTHVGCEHGVCGACTRRLDGVMVRGCLTLAVQCEGASVETIEGVTDSGKLKLSMGGAKMLVDGKAVVTAEDREYAGLYTRFAELIRTGASDVDLAPLVHVADAFMLGRRRTVEPFVE